MIFQWQYIGFLYFWKIRQIDVCLHFFFHFPGLIIEEVTSRPRHLLQRRITQNTPMGGILSNNFSKKEKKNTSSFTSKNHWCKLNPVWESRTGTPKRLWWILYEYDGHFFLCFFTIYNIYNYLLTITSMHKFFLAPHLLGPLLLFVKKILISRRIRYKRVIWREKNHVIWFFSNQWIFDGPKKHYFPPRHKEAHQISRRRVVYTKYIYDEIFFSNKKLCSHNSFFDYIICQ